MAEIEFIKAYGPGIGILVLFFLGIFRATPVIYRNRSPRALWKLADTAIDDYAARVDRFEVETERRRSEVALNHSEASLNNAVLERIPPQADQAPCKCREIHSGIRRSGQHRRPPGPGRDAEQLDEDGEP